MDAILVFMELCRFETVGTLPYNTQGYGVVLGLDRMPKVKVLREKKRYPL